MHAEVEHSHRCQCVSPHLHTVLHVQYTLENSIVHPCAHVMLIYFAHLEFKKKIVFADKGLPVGVYFGCLMLGTTAVESLC